MTREVRHFSPMRSKDSVAHTHVDPPAASTISAIGAASNRSLNLALARRDDALDITPWPCVCRVTWVKGSVVWLGVV